MTRPRVLVFSLAPLTALGGAEVAVGEIVRRLEGEFEFEIISANLKNPFSKYFYPFWAAKKAKRLQQERPFDLVWAIMANQAGIAGAWFKNCFPPVPFLLTLQEGDDLNSLAYRLRLLLPRFFGVFRRADYIQAISNYLANWARQLGATCPVSVIPNGVDLSKLITKDYRLNPNPVIVTTSRLVPKNGVDTLIRTFPFLPANLKLRIVGDGPERAALEVLSSKLKLGDRIEFWGSVPSAKIGDCLAQAEIFCRPSRSEGLGNSFLEAMAAGLPTIGTPVGGIPDFLVEGETGWLCKADNPKSLAEKIELILDPASQSQVERVVLNAQKLVREKYDWAKLAPQLGQLFSDLIAKKC